MSNQVTKTLLLSMLLLCFASALYASNCGNDPSDPACKPSFSLTWQVMGSGQQHTAQSSGPVWMGSYWLINLTPQPSNGYSFTGGQVAANADPFLTFSFGVDNVTNSQTLVFNYDYSTPFSGTQPIYAAKTFFSDRLQYTGASGGHISVAPDPGGSFPDNFLQNTYVDGVLISSFSLGKGCIATEGSPCSSAGPFTVSELYSHSANGTLEIQGQFIIGFANGVSGQMGTYGIQGQTNLDPLPEPGSLLLLGTGILGLAGVVRRKVSP